VVIVVGSIGGESGRQAVPEHGGTCQGNEDMPPPCHAGDGWPLRDFKQVDAVIRSVLLFFFFFLKTLLWSQGDHLGDYGEAKSGV
jgi:hypothetical protein